LHDDELLALAISSNGRYIASAGLDKKVYVWSFEAALRHGGDPVRVPAYIAVVNIIFNPCMMATHSLTRSSRQAIAASLSHYISLLS
jgi:hypothetical protein